MHRLSLGQSDPSNRVKECKVTQCAQPQRKEHESKGRKNYLLGGLFSKPCSKSKCFKNLHTPPPPSPYLQFNPLIDMGSSSVQTGGDSGERASISPTRPESPDRRSDEVQASSSTAIVLTSPLPKALEKEKVAATQSKGSEIASTSNAASTASSASNASHPACGEISVFNADRRKFFMLDETKASPVHVDDRLTSYYLTQLATLFEEGKLQVSFRDIANLLKKPQKDRTLQDLRDPALLDPTQLALAESQTLSATQLRYLTSNGVILALAQGIQTDLIALSRIPDQYFGIEGFDQNGIFEAIYNNAHNVIEDMVKSNLFIAITDPYGNTSLHNAAKHSLSQCVEALLAQKADPNTKNIDGNTALHYAKNLEIVENLLTHGADPNAQNKQRKTPLHQVAESLNTEIAYTLLKHGADPDRCDEAGNRSLYWVHQPT